MQQVFKQATILSISATLSFLLTGCGESKIAQCNKMIKVANQAVTLSQEFSKNPQRQKGSKALIEVASKIDPITSEMQALEIKDEKLQGFQGRFVKLYQDTSKGLKDTATAIDKKNIKSANASLATLRKSSSEESAIVSDINKYCSGK